MCGCKRGSCLLVEAFRYSLPQAAPKWEVILKDMQETSLSIGQKKEGEAKTYNSRYSLVVTDPTTNQPLTSLTMGERTGSRIF